MRWLDHINSTSLRYSNQDGKNDKLAKVVRRRNYLPSVWANSELTEFRMCKLSIGCVFSTYSLFAISAQFRESSKF